MNKFQCTHIKDNGKRCGNKRNAHPFTDPSTFTCESHGNVHTTLPEKDIVAGNRLAEAMTNNTQEAPVIIDENAITTVFITGRYNGPDKKTDAGTKVLVHGKYEFVGYTDPKKAVEDAYSLLMMEEHHVSDVAINHAFVRMSGIKYVFNVAFTTNLETIWSPVRLKDDAKYILVTDWAKCPRCSGKGEVSYGNWSRHDTRLHRSVRTCFHCHGTGYRGAQG